jgi:UDP-glucose 4-epimerase
MTPPGPPARTILVTGSAGHLGEALMRTLPLAGYSPLGLDIKPSPFTEFVGSIADREFVRTCMRNVDAIVHTATLHKPHVVTHRRQDFIDTNVTGTLNLLEEAVAAGIGVFIFTSTTSVFGRALTPAPGDPAAWITEDVTPVPRNIYGVTKVTAENLCELVHRDRGLACLILRTSRFFPEADDRKETRDAFADANVKVNEFLYRRADIEDDLGDLRTDAPGVVRQRVPDYEHAYAAHGWRMFPTIDRVYVNDKARRELGWKPRYDFAHVLGRISAGDDFRSPLAQAIGSKSYHDVVFEDGPYPT